MKILVIEFVVDVVLDGQDGLEGVREYYDASAANAELFSQAPKAVSRWLLR